MAISEELKAGIERYNEQIRMLGGYGTRIRATMPNGDVHEGTLIELGFGGCQPGLRRDDGRKYGIVGGLLRRPDNLDRLGAFRAGYRHGADIGPASPKEADTALRALPTTIPCCAETVELFCNGSEDGSRGDSYRYTLSFLVT